MRLCYILEYRLQEPNRCIPFHRTVEGDWCILLFEFLILYHKLPNIWTILTIPCNLHQLLRIKVLIKRIVESNKCK